MTEEKRDIYYIFSFQELMMINFFQPKLFLMMKLFFIYPGISINILWESPCCN